MEAEHYRTIDLNRDDRPDLMLVVGDTLKFYFNKGGGSFEFKDRILIEGENSERQPPFEKLKARDLNEDGSKELWIWTEKKLNLYKYKRDKGYFKASVFPKDGFSGRTALFTDLNGDDRTDVLLQVSKEMKGRGRERNIELVPYLNQGGSELKAAKGFSPYEIQEVEQHDLTGDGIPEIFVKVGHRTKIWTWNEDSTGYEKWERSIKGRGSPRVQDLNGDGLPELFGRSAFLNKGNGNFEKLNIEGGYFAFSMDLSGDGTPELLSRNTDRLLIYSVDEEGARLRDSLQFGAYLTNDLGDRKNTGLMTKPERIIRDFDQDGDLDLLLIGEERIELWKDLEKKGYERIRSIEMKGLKRFRWRDLDGNGKDDLLLYGERRDEKLSFLHAFLNEGNGSFRGKRLKEAKKRIQVVRWADVNGDGTLDLLTRTQEGNRTARKNKWVHSYLKLFLNEEGGSLKESQQLMSMSSVRAIQAQSEKERPEQLFIGDRLYLAHSDENRPKEGEDPEPRFLRTPGTDDKSTSRTIVVGDADGDPLNVELVQGKKYAQLQKRSIGVYQVEFKNGCPTERTSLTVQVTDGDGGKAQSSFELAPRLPQSALKWSFKPYAPLASEPVLRNGTLFISDLAGAVHALDAKTGKELWHYRADRPISSAPLVKDGSVYVGSGKSDGDGKGAIYALNAKTGEERWKFRTTGPVTSTPELSDSKLLVGTRAGTFYALDRSDGKEIWRFCTCLPIKSGPLLHEGTVFFGAGEQRRKMGSEKGCSFQACSKALDLGKTNGKSAEKDHRRRKGEKAPESAIVALNIQNGKKRWIRKKEVEGDFLSAPVLLDGTLILRMGKEGRDPAMEEIAEHYLALDANSGERSWKYGPFRQAHYLGFSGPLSTKNGMLIHSRKKAPDQKERASLMGIDPASGKEAWTRSLGSYIVLYEIHPLDDQYLAFDMKVRRREMDGDDEPIKAFDKKKGELEWSFAMDKWLPYSVISSTDNERLYLASTRLRGDMGPGSGDERIDGASRILALQLDPEARSKGSMDRSCKAPPRFKSFKGAQVPDDRRGGARTHKEGFVHHFKTCEEAILEYEHLWLTPKATHRIIGKAENGGCRIRTRLKMPESPLNPEIPYRSISYTLNPEKPFAPQLKKAVKSCISKQERGYDCKRVPKDNQGP